MTRHSAHIVTTSRGISESTQINVSTGSDFSRFGSLPQERRATKPPLPETFWLGDSLLGLTVDTGYCSSPKRPQQLGTRVDEGRHILP